MDRIFDELRRERAMRLRDGARGVPIGRVEFDTDKGLSELLAESIEALGQAERIAVISEAEEADAILGDAALCDREIAVADMKGAFIRTTQGERERGLRKDWRHQMSVHH